MVIDFTSLSSPQGAAARGRVAGQHSSAPPAKTGGSDIAPSATNSTATAQQPQGDTVKLSDAARALQRSEQNTQQVDQSRVDRLKALIDKGEYSVDARKIAEGMLNFDKLLG